MRKFVFMILPLVLCTGCNYTVNHGGVMTAAATGPAVSIVPDAKVMGSMAFSPSPYTVKIGTTVIWTNDDSTNHTVTSDSSVFDSGNLNGGQVFVYTFATAGTFTYHCNVHPSMVGSVVVQ